LLSLIYKAFGDSFAAGVGAGSVLPGDRAGDSCYRTTGGYPMIINAGLGNTPASFDAKKFVACTSAKAPQISEQFDKFMDQSTDIVTVSLGYVRYISCIQNAR
jgi:hypothetical protein